MIKIAKRKTSALQSSKGVFGERKYILYEFFIVHLYCSSFKNKNPLQENVFNFLSVFCYNKRCWLFSKIFP